MKVEKVKEHEPGYPKKDKKDSVKRKKQDASIMGKYLIEPIEPDEDDGDEPVLMGEPAVDETEK